MSRFLLILILTAFAPIFLRADAVTIMPFGDSITMGYHEQPPGTGGYRGPLGEALTAAGIDFKFVGATTSNSEKLPAAQQHHNGFSGYPISAMLRNLDASYAYNTDNSGGAAGNVGGFWMTNPGGQGPQQPDVILLMAGTNEFLKSDANGGVSSHPSDQRAAATEERMTKLLDWFKTNCPKSKVYVATLLPVFYQFRDGHDVRVEEYNAWLRTYVPTLGANFQVVDMFPLFVADGNLNQALFAPKDVHPNHEGYAVLAKAWADAIIPSLKAAGAKP